MTKKLKTNIKAESKAVVSGSVDKKPLKITMFKNAVSARYKNKRTSVIRSEKLNHLRFVRTLEKDEDIKKPTCKYKVLRGKIAITSLCMSDEGLEALHIAIGEYLRGGYITDH